jgi:AbrB family looped-hinge helix DNA binding protein
LDAFEHERTFTPGDARGVASLLVYGRAAGRKGTADRVVIARDVDRPKIRRYLTSMKTTVSSRGQIVIPAELRLQDKIEAGQEFDVERVARGEYRLTRRKPRSRKGLIDRLLACPVKDWFVPLESESTDTL